jgi:CRP/FNR family transcriptional regulator, cyclic AMP receptor protein
VSDDAQLVRLLDADPELGARLDPNAFAAAHRLALARTLTLPTGGWDPRADLRHVSGCLGVLVLEGLIKREVELASSGCAELLGQGDVIRPWDEDQGGHFTALEPAWEILETSRIALLDGRIAAVAGRWPALLDVLLGRVVQRSRSLAFHMALSNLTRVDLRLLALFWHLADRWGRVGPDGVVLPLRLPHRTLAGLVGAQRPSVTTALGTLSEAGRLTRRSDGSWLLHGEPPVDLRGGEIAARARVAG